jgi:hypothetical protein
LLFNEVKPENELISTEVKLRLACLLGFEPKLGGDVSHKQFTFLSLLLVNTAFKGTIITISILPMIIALDIKKIVPMLNC